MLETAFNVRLAAADWDDTMNGWRCPALNVPGAEVEDIYVEGVRVDRAKYEVLRNHATIRWAASDRPERATVSIVLTRALSLGAETDRWRRLAIILPVIATISAAVISAGATYFASRNRDSAPTQVASTTGGISQTEVSFINNSGTPVTLFWDSGNGQPQKFTDIESGASFNVFTYEGQRWIARNAAGHELLNYTVKGNTRNSQVEITK